MKCGCLQCKCGKNHFLAQRYVIAIMSLTGILVGYGQRVSLNIAITEMTDKNASISYSCPMTPVYFISEKKKIKGGTISWSNSQQNIVLSSFYPGYLLGHIPAGIWCDRFGSRYVFSMGIVLSTVVTLVTPVIVVTTPYYITSILRAVVGVGQSVMYPAISTLYARWVPANERSMLGAFSFAANALGIICGNLFTGLIISVLENWPIGFYFWGALGVVWVVIFLFYVYSEPAACPHITAQEKEFLDSAIHKRNKLRTPWLSFVKDSALWGLIVCSIGHDFTIFSLTNNFPKYMSDVMHLGLRENSLASSLPYIGQWVGGLVAGEILDNLVSKKGAPLRPCRAISTTIGMVVAPAFLVIAGYMGCRPGWIIVFFSLALFAKGPTYCGMKVNHLDLSHNFAGILMALINGLGSLAGWLSPRLISVIAPNNDLKDWRMVFWTIFIVAVVCNVVYVCTCRAERRKWDVPPEEMEDFLKKEQEKKDMKQEKKEAKLKKKEEKKAAKRKKNEEGPKT